MAWFDVVHGSVFSLDCADYHLLDTSQWKPRQLLESLQVRERPLRNKRVCCELKAR